MAAIEEEFNVRNFLLGYNAPEDFFTPRFACMGVVGLFILKGVFMICTVLMYITNLTYTTYYLAGFGNFIKYIAVWNYTVVVLYFLVAFIVSGKELVRLRRRHQRGKENENILKDSASEAALKYENVFHQQTTARRQSSRSELLMDINSRQNQNPSHEYEYASYSQFSRIKRPEANKEQIETAEPCGTNHKFAIGLKLMWVLHNIAFTMTVTIVSGYWSFIHDYSMEMEMNLQGVLKVDVHGFVLLFLVVDLFMSRLPYRLLHFVHPFVLGFTYVIFHVAFWSITGDYIYDVTNWGETPGLSIGAFAAFLVAICIFHFILFLFNCSITRSTMRTKVGYLVLALALLFMVLLTFTFLM